MPKRAKELTATAVERLKADGEKNRRVMVGPSDCAGLHLRLEGGTKSWALRIKVGDKRRDIGLGPYNGKVGMTDEEAGRADGLSLAEARTKARELRRMARETGAVVSPTAAVREAVRAEAQAAFIDAAKAKTFKECADLCVADKRGEWKSAKHELQWMATLKTYAFPKLGPLPVGTIDRGLVLDVLRPIWNTKNETASRLRGRIETILNWAKVNGYRDGDNPAAWKGNLEHSLSKRQKLTRGHHAALPHAKIGTFMAELTQREGVAAKALHFAILCASRSQEVRLAKFDEFDLEAQLWVIPAERMKAGKEHHVPLSEAAVAIVAAQKAVKIKGNDYVFPAPRGGKLSDMSLTAVLKRMDYADLTQHGFRSTFRDWAGETTAFPREVIEHALAHQIADKAEAAYQRGTLFPKRVKLMEEWAKRCSSADAVGGNVVSLKGAA
ncbi:tyrosine-type recombinase/integrase [Novosphingobium mangrovi (ex Hu et al. 2023)]|uniref:Tyrosine-type recombinase/integrase n=1 Tax=Novosphingobium mangrovi (ex Hu et al. 2023) TaxID=2930094 RepID=A0ABT0A9L9_9SPHN|nr:site-specific integrase [Novosphingobium mangrovi (ex Hu et al. 2023)]MCJ1959890.1 tyrosine-type recombinase/integrase [Novosphingobium mangrovi (ex Hu et al. 2023)]